MRYREPLRFCFWSLLYTLLVPSLGWAEGDVEALEHYFSSLETLQGAFNQQVYGADGGLIEESYGTLRIQRPGRFQWHTSVPYLQEVVGDGERIWIYDPDLEQVTVHRQQGALSNTPAALLTHQGVLNQHFTLSAVTGMNTLNWVALIPKQGDGGYEQLRVAMEGEQLRAIEVEDSLGQRTRITLYDLVDNLSLPDHHFHFVLPEGVDVVGDL